jgi:hypothetical protein
MRTAIRSRGVGDAALEHPVRPVIRRPRSLRVSYLFQPPSTLLCVARPAVASGRDRDLEEGRSQLGYADLADYYRIRYIEQMRPVKDLAAELS